MSDRSPEDEMIAEVRKFGHTLTHLLRLHAQAGNWLERRKIRKDISLQLREQRREEQTARAHQLVFTQQMIDRYRTHALTIAERAADPSVDHERRYRDTRSLTRHANDLRARIVANTRLTQVEQGIALDGLDAATAFPRFEPGRLFDRAHKVRGIDALKYRAQVARTVREQQAHTPQRDQLQTPRFEASLTWSTDGHIETRETRGFDNPREGLAWMYCDIDHTVWPQDRTTVEAVVRDRAGRPVYQRQGRPELVAEQLEHPLGIIRTADGAYRQQPEMGVFADAEALADHHRTIAEAAVEQSIPKVDRTPQRTEPALGGEHEQHGDWLAQVERQLTEIVADRDRLGSRVGMLQRGLDGVTTDRDEIKRKLDTAEGHIEALKNRNLRLAAEIEELRDRPGIDQVTAERDRLQRERDEAVQKLVQATPEHERYGSDQRRAATNTDGADRDGPRQRPESTGPGNDAGNSGVVGKRASYLRDLGASGHEQPGTESWPHPERNGQGRNGIDRSR
ncbi:hypothetical protein AB0C34_18845 [Nocardia sp. NPDC049220]|uniref:hypothetical protein n=1 Tax=Nocardia sp. NPDC049220 TaxID=3155273 RepID=UPI0033DF24B8